MTFSHLPDVCRCMRGLRSLNGIRVGRAAGLVFPLLAIPLLCVSRAIAVSSAAPHKLETKRVSVRIIARGSSVRSSTGNMDTYIAVITSRKHENSVTIRLVNYYPPFADGLPADRIDAGDLFLLRLRYAPYCDMNVSSFAIQQTYDEDSIRRMQIAGDQSILPCFLIHD